MLKTFFKILWYCSFIVSFADVLIYRWTYGKIELIYLMFNFIFNLN